MRRENPFLTCDEEVHVVVYDPERAEPVCSKCGLVIDEMKLDFLIELYAVPRRRASHPRKSRTSSRSLQPSLLERSLLETLSKKSIHKVVEEKALELCRIIRKQQFHTGYPVSTLSSALVYMAHRLCRVPATFSELAASATERKRVIRCYDSLCRRLGLNVPRCEHAVYLSHLAERRKVDDSTVALANEILERAKEKRLVGGANPIGIAAASLYVAGSLTGNTVTQKELASVAMVSEVTVRTGCKMLSGFLQTPHARAQQRV